MKYSRGLAALTFILLFQALLNAEYLYKDEIVHNPQFREDVNQLGSELYEKTGISLRLVMIRELPEGQHISEYEKELMKEFSEPTILLTFSELDSKVDILASDESLYKYFDKKQILSPVASFLQAFVMATFYSDSFSSFKETISDHGGTIIPLLAQKAKKGELLGKYSGSMFNGYGDIADQIAQSKGIKLEHGIGNANKNVIFVVKSFFYLILLYGIFAYLRRVIFRKRHPDELK
ncbi:MAG: 3-dehydroquinate dehydratase [Helicobacteraceae bacterium CG2_30_36_10]|nr:MAG: 3-dehydroquinate dehydratase [Helicobacteraceae bacterium CG2_30_36_10]